MADGKLSAAHLREELRKVRSHAEHLLDQIAAQKHLEQVLRAEAGQLQDLLGRRGRLGRDDYREIFDAVDAALFVHDARTARILEVNRKAEEMFGVPREALCRMTVGQISADEPPYTQERAKAFIRRAAAGEPVVCEWRARRRDGECFWVEVDLRAVTIAGSACVLAMVHDISRRKESQAALARQRSLLSSLMDHMPDHIYFKDRRSRFLQINRAMAADFGLNDPAEAVGKTDFDFFEETHAREALADEQRVMETGEPIVGKEERVAAEGGREEWVSTTKVPLRDAGGAVIGTFGISRSITERRQLEEQMRQAQKMEAVGRLAGGVAHDFSNELTVIGGYCDLLLGGLGKDDPSREALGEIRKAVHRSVTLTGQLLAFSRRQILRPQAVDVSALVTEMAAVLSRMVGEDVSLTFVMAERLPAVQADPGQLQQAVVNLVANARDAIRRGGQITIETSRAKVGRHPPVEQMPPGCYVRLVVRDTGCGMDEATMQGVFEPFFTTKAPGRGTGLGLAIVYGFVRQSGGYVCIDSTVGVGTCLTIYLPCAAGRPEKRERAASAAAQAYPTGSETVLVVEDDGPVRELVVRVLRRCGYTVLATAGSEEALAAAADTGRQVDLLVTDVIMPGLAGPDLARQLRRQRPGLRTLFISGYTGQRPLVDDVAAGGASLLAKPFTPAMLANEVRRTLDEEAPGGDG